MPNIANAHISKIFIIHRKKTYGSHCSFNCSAFTGWLIQNPLEALLLKMWFKFNCNNTQIFQFRNDEVFGWFRNNYYWNLNTFHSNYYKSFNPVSRRFPSCRTNLFSDYSFLINLIFPNSKLNQNLHSTSFFFLFHLMP